MITTGSVWRSRFFLYSSYCHHQRGSMELSLLSYFPAFVFEMCVLPFFYIYSGILFPLILLQWRGMRAMASKTTGASIVCSTACSNYSQRKNQSSHHWPFVMRNHLMCIPRNLLSTDILRMTSHKSEGVSSRRQLDWLLQSCIFSYKAALFVFIVALHFQLKIEKLFRPVVILLVLLKI